MLAQSGCTLGVFSGTYGTVHVILNLQSISGMFVCYQWHIFVYSINPLNGTFSTEFLGLIDD